ncbi:DUF3299 domain-containing protein [Vibrio sp. La 4.2.2]|uniref:DUF3299 domain-containing protein n=1 Tax=Vibrio sp. La 4.2.2 TaxID=2998830 RepID=UPI0022CDE289|nr:DUF3299 domain-containing protein [Vibrio sp. La 4.2.2]MDA0111351.1 DUF3299 domain-containing protein [Vibrio sp. La 4.2.2]
MLNRCSSLIVVLFSFSVSASQISVLDWTDLKPQMKEEIVVLPDITEAQRESLQTILLLDSVPNKANQKLANQIIVELGSEGVDARDLLEKRATYMAQMQARSETTTDRFDKQHIRMAGFIVPLEMTGEKSTDFLLVPVAGACIHLPPPPANQIVRIRYPEGFEIKNVQYPVWVEGIFNSDKQTEDVFLVDGNTSVTMGYSMEATNIEDYYQSETL